MSYNNESTFLFSFELNSIIMMISVLISVFFSLLLIIIINDKSFNFSKLLFNIAIAETLSLFSSFWFIVNIFNNKVNVCFAKIVLDVHLYFLRDLESTEELLDKINIIFFNIFQTFAIFMNFFVCLEMILTLRDPVSKSQRRIQIYTIIVYATTLIEFISLLFTDIPIHKDNNQFIGYILFNKFIVNLDFFYRIFKVFIFVMYSIIGVTSIFFIIVRFRKTTNIAKDMRNKFVLRHIFSVLIYVLLYIPYFYYETIYIIQKKDFAIENHKYLDVSL